MCIAVSILSDEQYLGTYIAGKTRIEEVGSGKQIPKDESEWVKIPGHHLAIVSRELFDRARQRVDKKGEPLSKRKLGTHERYAASKNSPLRGKVSCGSCGHAMTLSETRNAAYHCRFTIPAPDAECHRLRFAASELEAAVYKIICEQARVIMGIDRLGGIQRLGFQTTKHSELDKQITEMNNQKCALYERFVVRDIGRDEYIAEKKVMDAEYDRLLFAGAAVRSEASALSAKKNTGDKARKLAGDALASDALTRSLVDLLIERVFIFPGERFEIAWKVSDFADTGEEA